MKRGDTKAEVEVLPAIRVDGPVAPRQLSTAAGAALQGALDAAAMWEQMRPIVASYIGVLTNIVERQRVKAETYTEANHDDFVREAHATIGSIVTQIDRLARAQMSMTKSADTAARLAKFLEGPIEDDNLGDLSVSELARIVKRTAETLK